MSVYRKSRQKLTWLVQLLFMPSTTSAVSLQDFQAISISQVPSLPCLSAYGNTILGCARSDFQDGIQCSASCANGVLQDQANIISSCRDVHVDAQSLLGLTLQGGLLDALCPNFQTPMVTSPVKPVTTSSSATTTTESLLKTTLVIPASIESPATIQSETDATIISAPPTDMVDPTVFQSTDSQSASQTSNGHPGSSSRVSSGGENSFDPFAIGSLGTTAPGCVNMITALELILIVVFLVA
ncbi:hypothetical protein GGS21DRAFT_191163 [Xylaria nigripes]|nr:hypothetical protein GGS21DRAFT_191163 [Xylaria nigripes]